MQKENSNGKQEMSFSGKIKEELARQWSEARHCQIAELAAIISMCGKVSIDSRENYSIKVRTENVSVARKYFTLLKKTFNIETAVFLHESAPLKRGRVYVVEITNQQQVEEVIQAGKIQAVSGNLNIQENSITLQQSCCKRAFVRGAFLSSGSISDPRKGYHFEIVCSDQQKAEQLQELIRSFQIDAKIVLRKKSYVVYVKEGAQIVDILAVMEANVALMNLENIRILKEMRNSVNRKVNCETANINKTVSAAVKQIEDIRLIERRVGFYSLNEGLAEIAELRLQYPEATLKELGMMLNPQVGKSGVNHRLRKLSEIADELRNDKEELL